MSTGQLIPSVIDMTSAAGRGVYDGVAAIYTRAAPNVAFELITDVDRLPQWNAQIPRVIRSVDNLVEGSEWVIVQRGFGPRVQWNSRARVIELDRATRRFVYRSQSEGPNPSFAMWTWHVDAAGTGSIVTVRWQLNPKTFWRRALAVRLRHRQLAREVNASLGAMARLTGAWTSA